MQKAICLGRVWDPNGTMSAQLNNCFWARTELWLQLRAADPGFSPRRRWELLSAHGGSPAPHLSSLRIPPSPLLLLPLPLCQVFSAHPTTNSFPLSVWEIVGQQGGGLSVLRTFRLMRVLKLVRFMPALQRQLVVLMKTMDNVATFCMLLMLFIFIFRWVLGESSAFRGVQWDPMGMRGVHAGAFLSSESQRSTGRGLMTIFV